MKIVVSSDWHLDHVSMGVRRFDDVKAAVLETVELAEQAGADGYFFLGDLCDPDKNMTVYAAVEFAIHVALRLRKAKIPSFWLAGNHDVVETSEGKTTLSPLRPLMQLDDGDSVHVFEEQGFKKHAGWPFVVGLPFTSSLRPYEPAKFVSGTQEIKGQRDCITIGHLNIPGVIPGEETIEMPRGREVVFPIEEAKKRSSLMMNGHYHRQQQTKDGIHIPGSLARLTAGEGDNKPGCLLIEVEV